MISKKILFILPILVFFYLLGPPPSHAQAPGGVIVIYPAVEAQADNLALSIFFVITDQNGQPISRAGIETVEIELLGGNNVPVPATFGDPQTPFYVALLLDASGSMSSVMPATREAAQEAIDSAPSTAYFAVIRFNELAVDEELRPIEDFTNDFVLVKGAIKAVESEPGAPTCLYNAAYQAIELLDEVTRLPQERQAIILFTDGKDERADGTPCSQRQYNDVINRAIRAAPITPIHTVGLCSDARCSNINQAELRSMAKETFAFSAIGSQDQLGDLFRQIMTGLSSQWVAKTNLFPRQGPNQAVLSVKLRDFETPLTTTFDFVSDRDYNAPPPPVAAQITNVFYDQDKDVYTLALSVTSPESVHKIVLEVWDEKSGTQVPPAQEFENPTPTLQIERPTEGLEAGREYSFRLKAVDNQGLLITTEEGETILNQQPFVYDPPQVEAVVFTIKSVEANFKAQQLTVDLDILDPKQEVNSYEGFIVDDDTGAPAHNFEPTLFTSGNLIQEKLPETIQQLQEPRTYRLTFYLTTKDGRRIAAEPYSFKVTPPAPPGLLIKIWQGLQNTTILISIFVIILCVTGVVIYWNRPARQDRLPAPLPRPPIDHTVVGGPSISADIIPQPRQVGLRIEVLETPDSPQGVKKTITRFPCVIGRTGCDLNINDQHISRRHAEITEQDGKFFVTDLESRNGTFIGEAKLPPHTPTPFNGLTIVRLGRRIQLKLEP